MKELFGRRSSESSDQQQQQQQEQQGSAQEAASAAGPGGSDEKSRPNREAPTKPGLLDRVRSTATVVIKEMVAAVSAETPSTSAMRGAPKGGSLKTAETTALAHHSVAEPAWQKQWRELQNKVGGCVVLTAQRDWELPWESQGGGGLGSVPCTLHDWEGFGRRVTWPDHVQCCNLLLAWQFNLQIGRPTTACISQNHSTLPPFPLSSWARTPSSPACPPTWTSRC